LVARPADAAASMVFMPFSSLGVRIDVFSGVADVSFMSDVVRHIGKDVKLGENVQIWNFTYIGNGAVIGDNTKIGSLVQIGRRSLNGCWLGVLFY